MEEVSRSDRPLPVKVIARRCRLHVSTAYHLVRTLCYEGYLVRLPSGDYVAGSGLAERFHDLMNSLRRPPQARAVLRQLAETTGHSAYLACISGQRLVVVDLEEGERSPWLEDLQPGLDAAAHATAVGKALLATLPRRDRRELLAEHGMRPFTSNTVTEPGQIESELAHLGPRRRVLRQHRGPRGRARHLVGAGHRRPRPGHARGAARRTAVRGQRPHLRPESPALMPLMNAAHPH
jgi:DNA-binding IclR family transcriptional regulator